MGRFDMLKRLQLGGSFLIGYVLKSTYWRIYRILCTELIYVRLV